MYDYHKTSSIVITIGTDINITESKLNTNFQREDQRINLKNSSLKFKNERKNYQSPALHFV
jgi:hypothetical protein